MKGNRQHGGPFDEERQVGTGQWPNHLEWAVSSVRRNTGLQNCRLAGNELWFLYTMRKLEKDQHRLPAPCTPLTLL